MEDELTTLARTGFQAYNDAAGGLNYAGKPIPPWNDVGQDIRDKWKVATKAIVVKYQEALLAEVEAMEAPPVPVVVE